MVLVSCIGLTVAHAGPAFGEKGSWARLVATESASAQRKPTFTRFIGWPEDGLLEEEHHVMKSSLSTAARAE